MRWRPSKKKPSPVPTFTLRVTPERAPDVHRTLELRADQTLIDLHDAIQRHLHLDDDHLYSFYLSGDEHDHAREFRGLVTTAGERSAEARLKNLGLTVGHRFLHVFDYGDQLRHAIEVIATDTAREDVEYPRLVESVGKAPPQYNGDPDAPPLDEDLQRFAEEVAAATERMDDAMDADEDPPRETLLADLVMARRLLEVARERPVQLYAIESRCVRTLELWIDDLALLLGIGGLVDEALALCDDFIAADTFTTALLMQRAEVLAHAGRHAEAIALVESNLARFPDDELVLERTPRVLRAAGALSRAEEIYRRAMERNATEHPDDAGWINKSLSTELASLLVEMGGYDEAIALRPHPEDDLDPDLDESSDDFADCGDEFDDGDFEKGGGEVGLPRRASPAVVVPVRAAPVPGRNEPCTCGSGKKWKKCHGGPMSGAG